MSVTINFSNMAPPNIVEKLDYEAILAEMKEAFVALSPDYSALLESDPVIKLLEVCAYRELIIRQRVNDGGKAVMLAHSTGTDLDNLAALFGISRLLVDAGDLEAVPPVQPTYEDDANLRKRTQLSLEGITTAGSSGSYVFHTLSASGLVKDVDIYSPAPGQVTVTVLSTQGDGVPDQELLDVVTAALNHEDVRPLTDQLTVLPATIITYTVGAVLEVGEGPDAELIRQEAQTAITAYVADVHSLGKKVALSGIYAALHVAGVDRVTISQPVADIEPGTQQAAFCSSIEVTLDGGL
ncbi:MAG: baseplate J/gp47 family protein [Magnetococcales bacterium]|nr:baseplate J/gp47 family protein [Magnetococcales bacterium]